MYSLGCQSVVMLGLGIHTHVIQVLDLMASGMQHPNVLVREEVVNTCIMVSPRALGIENKRGK